MRCLLSGKRGALGSFVEELLILGAHRLGRQIHRQLDDLAGEAERTW